MKSLFFIGAFIVILTGCSMFKEDSETVKNEAKFIKEEKAQQPKLGGWYPVFFNKYNKAEVRSIVNTIKAGKVKKIIITYNQNEELAKEIRAGIQRKISFDVEMKQVINKDTDKLKFDHDKVVVTVYSK